MNLAALAAALAAVGETLSKADLQPPRLDEMYEEPPPARAVDCGACTACCHMAVYLLPWDDATQYETEADGMVLKRGPNGSCVYLGDSGCTIYERRPLSCRAFHCGVFVARLSAPERTEYQARAEAVGNRQFARLLAEGDKRRDGPSSE